MIRNTNAIDDPRVSDHRVMVKEQAAVWLIRISDNALSPDDVDDLREWIGRSDFHRDYFIQLSQSWDDMAVLQELAELFAVPAPPRPHSIIMGWASGSTNYRSRALPPQPP